MQPLSPHKQIRLPVLIDTADELAEERYVVWADGTAGQLHLRFFGCLTSLHVIAAQACRDEVLPCVLAAAAFWNDVIDGERHASCAAVLAFVSIAAKNILA